MQFSTYLALIGCASANTNINIDIDDQQLGQIANDVQNRVMQFQNDNGATIMDVLDKLESTTNEALTYASATDNERTESLVMMIDAVQAAFMPNTSTCDNEGFA